MVWIRSLSLIALVLVTGCQTLGWGEKGQAEIDDKYRNESSQNVTIGQANIHFQDINLTNKKSAEELPTLVLLHGVAASLHTWDGWVAELSDQFRIIRLDLPGFGLTGPVLGREHYEIDYLVDTVDRFLEGQGVDNFYLAGNSLGGYIAWNYAVVYPEKVEKLILLDAAGFKQKMPFGMWLASLPVMSQIAIAHIPRSVIKGGLQKAYGDDAKVTEQLVDQYYEIASRPGNRAAYVQYFKQMRRDHDDIQLGDKVKGVKVPTLLMWGEEDEIVPLTVLKEFKKALPNAQSIVYPGVGHLPMEEIPSQTAQDAAEFLLR